METMPMGTHRALSIQPRIPEILKHEQIVQNFQETFSKNPEIVKFLKSEPFNQKFQNSSIIPVRNFWKKFGIPHKVNILFEILENAVLFVTGKFWKLLEFHIEWKLLPSERLYFDKQSTLFLVDLEYTFQA